MHLLTIAAVAVLATTCCHAWTPLMYGWQFTQPGGDDYPVGPTMLAPSHPTLSFTGFLVNQSTELNVVALTQAEGQKVWEYSADAGFNANAVFLVCGANMAIAGSNDTIVGLDLATGRIAFSGTIPNNAAVAPLPGNSEPQTAFTANTFAVFAILTPSGGTEIMSVNCEPITPGAFEFSIFTTNTTASLIDYFSISLQSYAAAFTDGRLYAVRVKTAAVDWSVPIQGLSNVSTSFVFTTVGGNVFVADSGSGLIQRFEQYTGACNWQTFAVQALSVQASEFTFQATGVVANAISVVLSTPTGTVSLDAATGEERWSDSTILRTSVVPQTNQVVYWNNYQVFCRHAWFGDVIWSSPATQVFQNELFTATSPKSNASIVLITNNDGALIVLDTSLAPAASLRVSSFLGAYDPTTTFTSLGVIAAFDNVIDFVYVHSQPFSVAFCGGNNNGKVTFSDGAFGLASPTCIAAATEDGTILYDLTQTSGSYDTVPSVFFAGYFIRSTVELSIRAYAQYTGALVGDVLFATMCGDEATPLPAAAFTVSAAQGYVYFLARTNCVYRMNRALQMEALPAGQALSGTVYLQADEANGVGAVYAAGVLIAFRQSQFDLLWQVQLRASVTAVVFYGPFLFVATNTALDCFLAQTGQRVSSFSFPGLTLSADGGNYALYNNTLFTAAGSGLLAISIDPSVSDSQRILWNVTCAETGGNAFVQAGPNGVLYTVVCGNIVAVQASTGATVWSLSTSNLDSPYCQYGLSGLQYDAHHNVLILSCSTCFVLNATNGQLLLHVKTNTNDFTAYLTGSRILLAESGAATGFQLPHSFRGNHTPATVPVQPPLSPTLPPNFVPVTMAPVPLGPLPAGPPPRPITAASRFTGDGNSSGQAAGILLQSGVSAAMLLGDGFRASVTISDQSLGTTAVTLLAGGCATADFYSVSSDTEVLVVCGSFVTLLKFQPIAQTPLWTQKLPTAPSLQSWLVGQQLFVYTPTAVFVLKLAAGGAIAARIPIATASAAPNVVLRSTSFVAFAANASILAVDVVTHAIAWNLTRVMACAASALSTRDFAIPDDVAQEQAQRGIAAFTSVFYASCTTAQETVVLSGEFSTGQMTLKTTFDSTYPAPSGLVASANSFYVAFPTHLFKCKLFDGAIVWHYVPAASDFVTFQLPMSTALSSVILVSNGTTNILGLLANSGERVFLNAAVNTAAPQDTPFALPATTSSNLITVTRLPDNTTILFGTMSCTAYSLVGELTLWSVGSDGHCTMSAPFLTTQFVGTVEDRTVATMLSTGTLGNVVPLKVVLSANRGLTTIPGLESVLSQDGSTLFSVTATGTLAAVLTTSDPPGAVLWQVTLFSPDSYPNIYSGLFLLSVPTTSNASQQFVVGLMTDRIVVFNNATGSIAGDLSFANVQAGCSSTSVPLVASFAANGNVLMLSTTGACMYALFSTYDPTSEKVVFSLQGLSFTSEQSIFSVLTTFSFYQPKQLVVFTDGTAVVYAVQLIPTAFELSWTFNSLFSNNGVTLTLIEAFAVVGALNVVQTVDVTTGNLLWLQPFGNAATNPIVPPLVGLSNYVYVLTAQALYKMDLVVTPGNASRILWSAPFVGVSSPLYQYLSGPTDSDVVVVCNKQGIFGVSAGTGAQLWRNTAMASTADVCVFIQRVPSQPLLALITTESSVFAISLVTGQIAFYVMELSNAVVSFATAPIPAAVNLASAYVNPYTVFFVMPVASVSGSIAPQPQPAQPQTIPPGFHFSTPAPTTVPAPDPVILGTAGFLYAWRTASTQYVWSQVAQQAYIYADVTHLFNTFNNYAGYEYVHVQVLPDGFQVTRSMAGCKPVWAGALTADGLGAYYCASNSSLVAFNGTTGAFLWSSKTDNPGGSIVTLFSPLWSYVSCFQPSGQITCLNPANGGLRFIHSPPCPNPFMPLQGDSTNGVLLVTCTSVYVRGINISTFATIYSAEDLQNNPTRGVSSTPIAVSASGGWAVSVCQNASTVTALLFHTRDGTILSSVVLPAPFALQDLTIAVLFPSDANFVVSGSAGIFGFEPYSTLVNRTVLLWKLLLGTQPHATIAADDLVFTCVTRGNISSLLVADIQTGAVAWNTTLPGFNFDYNGCPSQVAPPVAQFPSTIFLGASPLYAIDIRGQQVVGRSQVLSGPDDENTDASLAAAPAYIASRGCFVFADQVGSAACGMAGLRTWTPLQPHVFISTNSSVLVGTTDSDVFFGYQITPYSATLLWSQTLHGASYADALYRPLFADVPDQNRHYVVLFPSSPQNVVIWDIAKGALAAIVPFPECDGILPTAFAVSSMLGSKIYLGDALLPCIYTIDVDTWDVSVVQLLAPPVMLLATPQGVVAFDTVSRAYCVLGQATVWRNALGSIGQSDAKTVLVGSLVVFASSFRMIALSVFTGAIAWEYTVNVSPYLTASGGALYISSTDGLAKLASDPAAPDRVLWTLDNSTALNGVNMAVLVAYSGVVVFTNNFEVCGLDSATGKVLWTQFYASCSDAGVYQDWIAISCGVATYFVNVSTGEEAFFARQVTSSAAPMTLTNSGIFFGFGLVLALPQVAPSATPAPTIPAPTGTLPNNWTPPGAFSGEPTLPAGNVPPALGCVAQTVSAYTAFVTCVNGFLSTAYSNDGGKSFACSPAAQALTACIAAWRLTLPPADCSDGVSLLASILTESVTVSPVIPFCKEPATCSDGATGSAAFCAATASVPQVPMTPGFQFPAPANALPVFAIPSVSPVTRSPLTAAPSAGNQVAYYCQNLPSGTIQYQALAQALRVYCQLPATPDVTIIGDFLTPGGYFVVVGFNETEVRPFTALVRADAAVAAATLHVAYISLEGYPNEGQGASGLSGGAAAGIAVGVLVLVVAVCLVLTKVHRARRRAQSASYVNLNQEQVSILVDGSPSSSSSSSHRKTTNEMLRLIDNS